MSLVSVTSSTIVNPTATIAKSSSVPTRRSNSISSASTESARSGEEEDDEVVGAAEVLEHIGKQQHRALLAAATANRPSSVPAVVASNIQLLAPPRRVGSALPHVSKMS